MEKKSGPGVAVMVNEDQGIIEHIFAVMGNVDSGGDRICPGAFTKTLSECGLKVKVLDLHRRDSVLDVIGRPLEIRELGRNELPPAMLRQCPEATGGVYAKTQFLLNTPEGLGAFQRVKEGAITDWSFGYDAVIAEPVRETIGGVQKTVRNLREVKLYEYSPVIWGMNEATTTISAKDADSQGKTAGGAADLPLAPRERAWDGPAAEGRVRSWAGGPEAMDWGKYARAFFWHDSANPEQFGSYKLGFADVLDGTLTAIPRGIFAVAGVLNGARGGADLGGDEAAVKRKVAAYYKRMATEFGDDTIVAPWEKSEDKAVNLTARISEVEADFDEQFNKPTQVAASPSEEWWWPQEVYDTYLIVRQGQEAYRVSYWFDNQGNTVFAPREQWIPGRYMFVADQLTNQMSATPGDETKAGRVLAQRNVELIVSAFRALERVLTDAGVLSAEGGPAEGEPPNQGKAGPGITPPTLGDEVRRWLEVTIGSLEAQIKE